MWPFVYIFLWKLWLNCYDIYICYFKLIYIQNELFISISQDLFIILPERRTSLVKETYSEKSPVSMDYQDLLECAICHELLCNPCTLACEHSFCKECIDHITKFKENLIIVTCSLCEVEQVIESGFGNLKPPLVLKQMLDRANRYFVKIYRICSKNVFFKPFVGNQLFNLNSKSIDQWLMI